jgi:MoaA/NifB/PqqE/SkfB family radical SAM enzyme
MDRSAIAAWEEARRGHGLPFSTACVAPWVALEFDPAGWVFACCANQTYRLGRIGHDRLADLWNGERIATLRDAMRRWDFSVGCQSCRWHLEHGRMDPDAAVYEGYEVTDEFPSAPRAMTFALSNRCNLGCVMCNPALSSTLRHQAGIPALPSSYDDEFFEDLALFLPGLEYAKFLGGEPFLIPEHHRVWDLMEEVGGPPRLQVTTNGTVWNDRVERVLSRFATDITVSIDAATAATYESIRRGAHHEDVLVNIERFRVACAAAGTELRLCFCLMANNWHELGAFLRWADELAVSVSINLVSDDGLALHDLPLPALDEVASTWSAQDVGLSSILRTNGEVWRTQLTQLEVVRAERRAGIEPPSKQPRQVSQGFFAEGPATPSSPQAASAEDVEAHRARLERWSGGGQVAIVEVDGGRSVRSVIQPHLRLGIVAANVVGRPLDEVVTVISAADGRPAWVLDVERFDDHTVRMIGLSTNPVRGNPASMVRTIELASGDGTVLLVAEDRLLDEPAAPAGETRLPEPTRRLRDGLSGQVRSPVASD